MQGQGVVERRDGDVAAVDDQGPGCVGVQARAVVEAPEGGLAGGGGADGAGPEAGALVIVRRRNGRGMEGMGDVGMVGN